MRTSLIIFGVIFLVIGIVLYLVPMQNFGANTTTTGNGNTDTRTSSASVTIPVEWAYGFAAIGFILLILGLVIPGPNKKSGSKKDSYDTVVESRENIEIGDGNKRKIVKERTEMHKSKKDKDDEWLN